MPGEGGSEYGPRRIPRGWGPSPVLQHYKKSRFDTVVGQVAGPSRQYVASEAVHRPAALDCVIIGRRAHPAGKDCATIAEVCYWGGPFCIRAPASVARRRLMNEDG